MTDKAAIQGFDQANHIARESLMDQNCGMADPSAIIFDSAEIEQVLPRVNSLFQVRVLLVLGSTFNSSNVNETHQEELEMLIMDLGGQ